MAERVKVVKIKLSDYINLRRDGYIWIEDPATGELIKYPYDEKAVYVQTESDEEAIDLNEEDSAHAIVKNAADILITKNAVQVNTQAIADANIAIDNAQGTANLAYSTATSAGITATSAQQLANAARTAANNAQNSANMAQQTASNAYSAANNAANAASTAWTTANNAMVNSQTARDASNNAIVAANEAQNAANAANAAAAAVTNIARQAQNIATVAQDTAAGALNISKTAQDTANVAKATADAIASTAQAARDTANTADNTAQTAENTACVAYEIGQEAKTIASEAMDVANTAAETACTAAMTYVTAKYAADSACWNAQVSEKTAECAQATANAAQATANAAQATANAASAAAGATSAAADATNAARDATNAVAKIAETVANEVQKELGPDSPAYDIIKAEADKAANAANNAANASNIASIYKDDAQDAANEAGSAASEASVSAGQAYDSASDAANAASNSANSAAVSANAANQARIHAENAANDANAAAQDASEAASYASNAATQALNASRSASNAANDATQAQQKAQSASNSANQASNSANQASANAVAAASDAANAANDAANALTAMLEAQRIENWVKDTENGFDARITQNANNIQAKVSNSKTGGNFGWNLTDTSWSLTSNNTEVLKADSNGLSIKGQVEADTGKIGGFNITDTSISKGTAGQSGSLKLSSGEKYIGYQSNNIGQNTSTAIMGIKFLNDLDSFDLYIRSWSEVGYDYTIASILNSSIGPVTSADDVNCKAHTRDEQSPGTDLASYIKVSYQNIHVNDQIFITYVKDGSAAEEDDRGYLLLPQSQLAIDYAIIDTSSMSPYYFERNLDLDQGGPELTLGSNFKVDSEGTVSLANGAFIMEANNQQGKITVDSALTISNKSKTSGLMFIGDNLQPITQNIRVQNQTYRTLQGTYYGELSVEFINGETALTDYRLTGNVVFNNGTTASFDKTISKNSTSITLIITATTSNLTISSFTIYDQANPRHIITTVGTHQISAISFSNAQIYSLNNICPYPDTTTPRLGVDDNPWKIITTESVKLRRFDADLNEWFENGYAPAVQGVTHTPKIAAGTLNLNTSQWVNLTNDLPGLVNVLSSTANFVMDNKDSIPSISGGIYFYFNSSNSSLWICQTSGARRKVSYQILYEE